VEEMQISDIAASHKKGIVQIIVFINLQLKRPTYFINFFSYDISINLGTFISKKELM